MNIEFIIKSWSACAAELSSQAQWQTWAAQPTLPLGIAVAELKEMPAMARRRLDPMGRMAVQVAWWCQQADLGMPVVFASRYGDATRSLEMLAELARGEAVSPTAFGLSVHNAIGAMYSIARGDRANCVAVAGGAASAASALVEAAALLADGAPEALVVCYDAPLPGSYAEFEDEPTAAYAWAWRVARPAANEPRIELAASPAGAKTAKPTLPFGLDVLRFALSADRTLERAAGATLWTWRRRG